MTVTKEKSHDYDNNKKFIDLRLTPQLHSEVEGKEDKER